MSGWSPSPPATVPPDRPVSTGPWGRRGEKDRLDPSVFLDPQALLGEMAAAVGVGAKASPVSREIAGLREILDLGERRERREIKESEAASVSLDARGLSAIAASRESRAGQDRRDRLDLLVRPAS